MKRSLNVYIMKACLPLCNASDRNLAIAKVVDQVAQKIGCSSAQIALNWLRQQDVIPIVGARKVSHGLYQLQLISRTHGYVESSQPDRVGIPARVLRAGHGETVRLRRNV